MKNTGTGSIYRNRMKKCISIVVLSSLLISLLAGTQRLEARAATTTVTWETSDFTDPALDAYSGQTEKTIKGITATATGYGTIVKTNDDPADLTVSTNDGGTISFSAGQKSITKIEITKINPDTITPTSETGWNQSTTALIWTGKATTVTLPEGYCISTRSITFTLEDPHTHSFTFSSSGTVITATCNNAGCDLTDSKVTLTISAPEKTVYDDGRSAAARLTDSDTFSSVTGQTPIVTYTGMGDTVYSISAEPPVHAGSYSAAVTVGNATASVDYTIAKADQSAPAAPRLQSKGAGSVILTPQAGYEYSYEFRSTSSEWQSNSTFDGLTPATDYTFYQRIAGDDDHNPSPASQGLSVKTDERHTHEWTFSNARNESEIEAACSKDPTHKATITLMAPVHTAYGDGKSPAAGIKVEGTIDGIEFPDVVYTQLSGGSTGILSAIGNTNSQINDLIRNQGAATSTNIRGNNGSQNISGNRGSHIESGRPTSGWVESGMTITSGGRQTVTNGTLYFSKGTATNTTVNSGGRQTVTSGTLYFSKGTATNTTVNSGGSDVSKYGGIASGTTVNSGQIAQNNKQQVSGNTRTASLPSGVKTFQSGSQQTNANINTYNNDYQNVRNSEIILKRAPEYPGTYSASITLGETTATVRYTIAPGQVTISYSSASDIKQGQPLSASTIEGNAVTVISGKECTVPGRFMWINPATIPTVADSNTTGFEALFIPTDPNYETKTFTISLKVEALPAASVITAPAARDGLVYTGSMQDLITPGTAADGCEMRYAVSTDITPPSASDYTTSVPQGKDAGTYYVWYVATGSGYADSTPVYLTVTIAQTEKPAAVITKAPQAKEDDGDDEEQELVTPGKAEGGVMHYAVSTDNTTEPADSAFTTSIPTASLDDDNCYVWYMAKGDDDHTDSAKFCLRAGFNLKTKQKNIKIDNSIINVFLKCDSSIVYQRREITPEDVHAELDISEIIDYIADKYQIDRNILSEAISVEYKMKNNINAGKVKIKVSKFSISGSKYIENDALDELKSLLEKAKNTHSFFYIVPVKLDNNTNVKVTLSKKDFQNGKIKVLSVKVTTEDGHTVSLSAKDYSISLVSKSEQTVKIKGKTRNVGNKTIKNVTGIKNVKAILE